MSEASELLETLRDIGEPPAPEGVPPALVIANAALLALLVGTLAWRVRRRRRAWLDAALADVRAARDLPPDAALLALATLLRRVMRHRHGSEVDALQGEAWLARLDATFGGDGFTRGDGRAFGDALYAPDTARDVDVDRLCRTLAGRLKRLPRRVRAPDTHRPASTRPMPGGSGESIASSPVDAVGAGAGADTSTNGR